MLVGPMFLLMGATASLFFFWVLPQRVVSYITVVVGEYYILCLHSM